MMPYALWGFASICIEQEMVFAEAGVISQHETETYSSIHHPYNFLMLMYLSLSLPLCPFLSLFISLIAIAEATRSTQRAQTSLAEADHYSHIAHCKNVEPWLCKTTHPL